LRNPDALALIAASSGAVDYADVNPFAFQPAIAPHLAARIEGRSIDLDLIEHAFHRLATTGTHLVVEGAGGWRVPLDGRSFMSEIPRRLALDVVLVVGLRLGCLNHALLTAEAVRADGLHLAGWVGNAIDPDFAHFDGNVATLHAVLRAPCLGIVPWEINPSADHLAGRLDLEPLLDEVVRPATAPGGKS
jgi:dethiobiotin synthetase